MSTSSSAPARSGKKTAKKAAGKAARKSLSPTALGLPAKPVKPRASDPPATHLRAKLDADLRAVLKHEPGTRSGVDPEDLHQMRVSTRRLRSILKTAGGPLGSTADAARAELGWLGGALGEVRDYDVLIGHLREVVAEFETADQLAGHELVSVFVAERARAKKRLRKVLDSERYRMLLQSVAQLTRRPDHEPEAAEKSTVDDSDPVTALRTPHRKLAKAIAVLPAEPPDPELHALRIKGKRLRYAAELALTSAKKKRADRVRKLISATKDLQTILGDHQDAVVAADRMRELVRGAAEGNARIGFIAGRIAERELVKRLDTRARWRSAWLKVDAAAQRAM
ncbi:CHAD domain-containing protein [Amycolatopsis minnesotensis]|uniref:CHAD domain-containing protein n=1 Tax=Amycolatopsis minnesotensis TaxID=337894 RepID=A0ABP5DWV2_9PSEU